MPEAELMRASSEEAGEKTNGATYEVGFRRPPLHSRFKPGQSGNPSGRPKDSKNFKTLLNSILNEQISLQEGSQSRKISKAEAIMRRLIIGALKGIPGISTRCSAWLSRPGNSRNQKTKSQD